MEAQILKTLADAGAVVVVLFTTYMTLRALFSFFTRIMKSDHEDFQTIVETWKLQAELQTKTNALQEKTNELLSTAFSDAAAGRTEMRELAHVMVRDNKSIIQEIQELKQQIADIKVRLDVVLGSKPIG